MMRPDGIPDATVCIRAIYKWIFHVVATFSIKPLLAAEMHFPETDANIAALYRFF